MEATDRFEARMTRALGTDTSPPVVTWTNNRVRLVSFVRREAQSRVRISRRMLALELEAADAVAHFVMGRRGARLALRGWFDRLPPAPRAPRERRCVTRGAWLDLKAVLSEVWPMVSDGPCDVNITWGRVTSRVTRRRSIQLGSYRPEHREIRIHRVLDHRDVPRWFLSVLVHHEVLHHVLGFGRRGQRRVLHGPEFRRREASHPRYEDACRWERENLDRLLVGDLDQATGGRRRLGWFS